MHLRKRGSTGSSHEGPPAKIKKENETPMFADNLAPTTKPFSECTITLAVDISGSTKGRTLLVEKQAVHTICSQLSETAKKEAKIVAWDHSVRSTVGVEDVNYLHSGGGTEPSNICSTESSISALRKSSLWFLMTDGEVTPHEVHKFANAVPNIQLHGTACVIIIFGHRPSMPRDVNVSVGYGVFAVAPHCLLLFHDTNTSEIFALRAKGCFEALLPTEDGPPSPLDTTWADTPRIKYASLAPLHIPAPIPLATDHIALSDGTTVSFNDVLNNRIPEPVSARLFANEEDMATIVVTAGSRGQGRRAGAWLEINSAVADVRSSRRMLTASSNGGHASLDGLGGRGVRAEAEPHSLGSARTLVEGMESRQGTGEDWDAYVRRVGANRGA
ncbi:MAG: hypothetical protein Q9195_003534 [Heterodermia aff. obscurata]